MNSKKLTALFCAVTMTFALASCGDSDSSSSAETTTTAVTTTTTAAAEESSVPDESKDESSEDAGDTETTTTTTASESEPETTTTTTSAATTTTTTTMTKKTTTTTTTKKTSTTTTAKPQPTVKIIASGNCGDKGDNVKWTFDENGTLTIFGSGKTKDYHFQTDPSPFFSDSNILHGVKKVVVTEGVTSIGRELLQCCDKLTSVTMADSINEIEIGAFAYCTALTDIKISKNVKVIENVFIGCTKLTSVTIPNGVTRIGGAAFAWCPSLKSITIPNSVKEIGLGAFRSCDNLTSITIPDSVTSIDEIAFFCCPNLSSITIPNSVTSIGKKAVGYNSDDTTTDITIKGKAGSAAEKYAKDNNLKFVAI